MGIASDQRRIVREARAFYGEWLMAPDINTVAKYVVRLAKAVERYEETLRALNRVQRAEEARAS